MFRPTQGHPQANKERTRNNKVSIQWDPILTPYSRKDSCVLTVIKI
jgi:hypothetical protein